MLDFDVDPGEDCPECGRTVRPEATSRLCHSCRVRPHEELVAYLVERIEDATDDHSVRSSISFAVRREIWGQDGDST